MPPFRQRDERKEKHADCQAFLSLPYNSLFLSHIYADFIITILHNNLHSAAQEERWREARPECKF